MLQYKSYELNYLGVSMKKLIITLMILGIVFPLSACASSTESISGQTPAPSSVPVLSSSLSAATASNLLMSSPVASPTEFIHAPTPMPTLSPTPTPTVLSIYGNSNGNIVHDGHAAQKDNWVFYTTNAIYKMQLNGKGLSLLYAPENQAAVNNINIYKDWIYFTLETSIFSNALCRMKSNGSSFEVVLDRVIEHVIIVDDWVYFTAADEDYNWSINKMRPDGTEIQRLNHEHTSDLNVEDGWIYYLNAGEDFLPCKMKTDGTDETTLGTEEYIIEMIVYKDVIYFINENSQLCKMNTDGTDMAVLIDSNVHEFNIYNNRIYYNLDGADEGSFRMNIDGTHKASYTELASNMNVVEGWIFSGDGHRISFDDKKYEDLKYHYN